MLLLLNAWTVESFGAWNRTTPGHPARHGREAVHVDLPVVRERDPPLLHAHVWGLFGGPRLPQRVPSPDRQGPDPLLLVLQGGAPDLPPGADQAAPAPLLEGDVVVGVADVQAVGEGAQPVGAEVVSAAGRQAVLVQQLARDVGVGCRLLRRAVALRLERARQSSAAAV